MSNYPRPIFEGSADGFDGGQARAPTITAKGFAPTSLAVSTVVRTSASAWAAHMALAPAGSTRGGSGGDE